MKRRDFILGSVAFHAVLLIIALLLPPPFPSEKYHGDALTYVELMPGRAHGRHGLPKPQAPAHEGPAGPSVAIPFSDIPALKLSPPVRQAQEIPPANPAPPPSVPRAVTPPIAPRAPSPVTPPSPPRANTPAAAPASPTPPVQAERPAAAQEPEAAALTAARPRPAGVKADRTLISFKSIKGWPVPAMVRMKLGVPDAPAGTGVPWRGECDSRWLILSPQSGKAPCTVKVGVDVSRLPVGYYETKVRFSAPDEGIPGDEVSVSVMVLPREKGTYELPHYAWDEYMNGNCKVCHLPENLMPSSDFMVQPEFCMLCHNPSGIAKDRIPGAGGHPMLVAAGSGGTKMPTRGTVPSGEKSDRMDTHFKAGKIVVCVTCHNVMEKPGEYGRAWEMASSGDRRTYFLSRGGWKNMGYIEPKVYVADTLMNMPRRLKNAVKYIADPETYVYDDSEGSITFNTPLDSGRVVYVTLTNPYLRVTTENNALCYDCHYENTHEGLNCLACHKAHGTTNKMGIRESVRTPDGDMRHVVYKGRQGSHSFAGGQDGICEVCHPLTKPHLKYAGTDCTRCHSHSNGFGI